MHGSRQLWHLADARAQARFQIVLEFFVGGSVCPLHYRCECLFATQDALFADVAVWLALAEFQFASECVKFLNLMLPWMPRTSPVCLRIANQSPRQICRARLPTHHVLASHLASSDAGLDLICGSTLLGGVLLGAALCFHDQALFSR